MNYLKTNSLSIIETNINEFKSLHLSQTKSIHLVLQSINGYLLKLTDVDESTKELYSFISAMSFSVMYPQIHEADGHAQ